MWSEMWWHNFALQELRGREEVVPYCGNTSATIRISTVAHVLYVTAVHFVQ